MPTHCMWGELFVVTRSQQERFVLLQLVAFVIILTIQSYLEPFKGNLQTHIVFPLTVLLFAQKSSKWSLQIVFPTKFCVSLCFPS